MQCTVAIYFSSLRATYIDHLVQSVSCVLKRQTQRIKTKTMTTNSLTFMAQWRAYNLQPFTISGIKYVNLLFYLYLIAAKLSILLSKGFVFFEQGFLKQVDRTKWLMKYEYALRPTMTPKERARYVLSKSLESGL